MACLEDIDPESEDQEEEDPSQFLSRQNYNSQQPTSDANSGNSLARRYVGELIQRVEFGGNPDNMTATFIM